MSAVFGNFGLSPPMPLPPSYNIYRLFSSLEVDVSSLVTARQSVTVNDSKSIQQRNNGMETKQHNLTQKKVSLMITHKKKTKLKNNNDDEEMKKQKSVEKRHIIQVEK